MKNTESKSQRFDVRVPRDVVEEVEKLIQPDETRSQFVVAALRTEIERRKKQLKK